MRSHWVHTYWTYYTFCFGLMLAHLWPKHVALVKNWFYNCVDILSCVWTVIHLYKNYYYTTGWPLSKVHTGVIQGGSNMTGTRAACLHTNQSRSYLNHLVQISLLFVAKQDLEIGHYSSDLSFMTSFHIHFDATSVRQLFNRRKIDK